MGFMSIWTADYMWTHMASTLLLLFDIVLHLQEGSLESIQIQRSYNPPA